MVTNLECPVCSETTRETECPSCGNDLSALFETRRAALRLARGAHALARERRIHEAADRAERGIQLFLNEELKKLFGWLLFLDGRVGLAARCWKSIPDQAHTTIASYNAALAAARKGASPEALDELANIQVPFRPATLLEWLCAEREGASLRADEARKTVATAFPDAVKPLKPRPVALPPQPTREPSRGRVWHPASLAIAGLVLLLAGAGLGYLLREPPQGTADGAVVSEPAAASPTHTKTPQDPVPPVTVADSLRYGWAYLNGNPGPVVEASGEWVHTEPIGQVHRIPAVTREEIARDWYLEGLGEFETNSPREAVTPLRAALASVGSTSDLYWVDDALYLLMRATAESNPTLATAAAQSILANHQNSIYANSVTRSMATETR